jgi:hypothetical protein
MDTDERQSEIKRLESMKPGKRLDEIIRRLREGGLTVTEENGEFSLGHYLLGIIPLEIGASDGGIRDLTESENLNLRLNLTGNAILSATIERYKCDERVVHYLRQQRIRFFDPQDSTEFGNYKVRDVHGLRQQELQEKLRPRLIPLQERLEKAEKIENLEERKRRQRRIQEERERVYEEAIAEYA